MDSVTPLGPATFIVGHPRSGTSLLRALLDGHPDLTVLPFETHLLDWTAAPDPVRGVLDRTKLLSTLQAHRPGRSREEVEAALRDAFAGARSARDLLMGLVKGWATLIDGDPGRRWVEKTPRHLYEMELFLRWFGPGTRFLVLRRDPRDVIASQLAQDPRRGLFSQALTCRVAEAAEAAWLGSAQAHFVRYEDLVERPHEVMGTVCRFLGLEPHPVVTEPTVMGDAYRGNSRFGDTMEGVSRAATGRYRTALTEGQIAAVEAWLAGTLRRGGWAAPRRRVGPVRAMQRGVMEAVVRSGAWRRRWLRDAVRRR